MKHVISFSSDKIWYMYTHNILFQVKTRGELISSKWKNIICLQDKINSEKVFRQERAGEDECLKIFHSQTRSDDNWLCNSLFQWLVWQQLICSNTEAPTLIEHSNDVNQISFNE